MTLPLFDALALSEGKPLPGLRPYQARTLEGCRELVRQKHTRILCVLPTGGGKMVLIANMIRSSKRRVLFVAHLRELIDHCVRQVRLQGIQHIGVLRGDDARRDLTAPTQIASIQTLRQRDLEDLGDIGLIFIDEAHRALAESYGRVLFDRYPNALIVGFTATPIGPGGQPLGGRFSAMHIGASYAELLADGHIVQPDIVSAPAPPDLSSLRVVHGDYEDEALGALMGERRLVGQIVEHWLQWSNKYPPLGKGGEVVPGAWHEGARRRTILFATNVAHSEHVCAEFRAKGVRIAHLDGTTPERDRDRILSQFEDGLLDVVSNCNVLLEGVDLPSAKCCVHARPTTSLTLYMQSGGRIGRPWEGVRPLLLDHAGNFNFFGGSPFSDRVWSLTNSSSWRQTPGRRSPSKECPACHLFVSATRTLCTNCGAELLKDAELPKIDDQALVFRDGSDDAIRRQVFGDAAVKAEARGFKPGFASAKYKERFGEWPPRGWSDELRGKFAMDAEWQARLQRREDYKAKEQAAAVEETAEEILREKERPETVTPEDDEDESFGAYLRKEGIE